MSGVNFIKIFTAAIGSYLAGVFGGWDYIIQILILFIALDYLTGLIGAWFTKNLSSNVGFKGLIKKFLILVIVALAAQLDIVLQLGEPWIRTAACFFYMANEGLSIIENAALIGVKVPEPVLDALKQVESKAGAGK